MRLSPHHRIHDGGPMYPRSISSPQSGHFRVSLIAPLCSAYRPSSATAAGERRWSARCASKLPATRKRKARRLFAAALWLGILLWSWLLLCMIKLLLSSYKKSLIRLFHTPRLHTPCPASPNQTASPRNGAL